MPTAGEMWKALEEHRQEFLDVDRELLAATALLRKEAELHRGKSLAELRRALGSLEAEAGAHPTGEWTPGAEWLPFRGAPRTGASHEEWIGWAETALEDVITFAVDGSQIFPSRDLSVPVAAIQVASFENRHQPKDFEKKTIFQPVAPAKLLENETDETGLRELVTLERYRLETRTLTNWMRANAGKPGRRLAIFDGTLIISFARAGQQRSEYLREVLEMVRVSHQTQIPLVAYLDSSRARDLANMYARLAGMAETRVTDGALLRKSGWGRRTPAFICARKRDLQDYEEFERDICFLYLVSDSQGRPARLEFPGWMLQAGSLEHVVNWVRAEIVAQADGYHYAIQAADALAVLTSEDREKFIAVFRQFARSIGLSMTERAKARSKRSAR